MSKHWIQTYAGGRFGYADDAPAAYHRIEPMAMAQSLAKQNRFLGHTGEPYSVAQHQLLVHDLLELIQPRASSDPVVALWALVHDGQEYVLGDWPRPFMQYLRDHYMGTYLTLRSIKDRVQGYVAERFGLPWPEPDAVTRADRLACLVEARDLFGVDLTAAWDDPELVAMRPLMGQVPTVTPHPWRDVARRYLEAVQAGEAAVRRLAQGGAA